MKSIRKTEPNDKRLIGKSLKKARRDPEYRKRHLDRIIKIQQIYEEDRKDLEVTAEQY